MLASPHRPDFIIIGAMKCATSTLHEQLARQPGFFMTEPKEPNFFSNDEVYAQGLGWYAGLFAGSESALLRGESSTHYTKLPTYPQTLARLTQALPPPLKLIYLMKHPVDRLVSHYIHEWSERRIAVPLDEAVHRHPELVAYSCYARQLAPFIEAYGQAAILPLFVPAMTARPDATLAQVGAFLGYPHPMQWQTEVARANVSAERLRMGPLMQWVVDQPLLRALRRNLVPRGLRERIKSGMQMRERPQLSEGARRELEALFDADLARLGAALGVTLNCANFNQITQGEPALAWV